MELISLQCYGMCLEYQGFEYCDLYCLLQAVENDLALSQESQEVMKQQHFADASERLDKMNRNQLQVRVVSL